MNNYFRGSFTEKILRNTALDSVNAMFYVRAMEQEKYRKTALVSLINILYVVTLWFVIIQNILKNEFLL
jgi:hypothetical protein